MSVGKWNALIGGGEGSTKTVKDLPKLAQTTYLEKDGKKKKKLAAF